MDDSQIKEVKKKLGIGAVQPEEVVEVVEVVLEVVKEIKSQLDKKIANNKDELDENLQSVVLGIKESEAKLKRMISQIDQDSSADIRSLTQQLNKEVNRIESMIPDVTDLRPLERKIEDSIRRLEKKIPDLPEELAPEKIRNKLESLKGDERLDISAIKGVTKRLTKISDDLLNRAISIVDNRTSFLISKTTDLRTDVNTKVTGWGTHNIYVQPTSPANPSLNDLWVDTS